MADTDHTPERDAPASVAAGVRGWLHDGVRLLRVRLELLGVEAQQHALDLVGVLVGGLAAVLLLVLGLAFLAVLCTVLLWDSHRTLALALFTAMFLTLGGVAAAWAWRAVGATRQWFSASLAELRRDEQRLEP